MGGTMDYARFRHRNGLTWRPTEHPDPYPPPAVTDLRPTLHTYTLLGDLNRFERDVMGVGYGGDEVAARYAAAAGTDVATVRQVLKAVFESGYDYGLAPVLDLPPVSAGVGSKEQQK